MENSNNTGTKNCIFYLCWKIWRSLFLSEHNLD